MAPLGAAQHHAPGAPAQMPRAQPHRERLAVHARQLALEPGVRLLRRPRRSLLRRLEQAHRTALDDHVPRPPRLGQWVLSSGSWYETFDEVDDASIGNWWARLPDFIQADYRFDLPPARMPFAQKIFTECGAPARCPQQPCRRSMRCEGGDGPPCFRADREPLQQMLFLSWMVAMGPATPEEGHDLMRRWGNPYRWFFAVEVPSREGRSRGRRRRARACVTMTRRYASAPFPGRLERSASPGEGDPGPSAAKSRSAESSL